MEMRPALRIARAPDRSDERSRRYLLPDRQGLDRRQVRVAGDHPAPVVDPDLAAANPIERRGRRVAELKRVVKRDLLLLTGPVEKARVDPQDDAIGGGVHRRAGRSWEVDALMDPRAVVPGRARQKVRIVGHADIVDRDDEPAEESRVVAHLPVRDEVGEARRAWRNGRISRRRRGGGGRARVLTSRRHRDRGRAEERDQRDRGEDTHLLVRYLYSIERRHL